MRICRSTSTPSSEMRFTARLIAATKPCTNGSVTRKATESGIEIAIITPAFASNETTKRKSS